jgi:hypothetical protein
MLWRQKGWIKNVRTRRIIGAEERISIEEVSVCSAVANSCFMAVIIDVGSLVSGLLDWRSMFEADGVRCEGLEARGRMCSVSGMNRVRAVPNVRITTPRIMDIQFEVFIM